MNRVNKRVGIILVLLLMIAVAVFLVFRSTDTSKADGFSEVFIEEIASGKADETYNLFTDQLKSSITKAEWAKQVAAASKTYESWKISKTSNVKEPEKTYGKGSEVVSVRYEIVADKIPYIMEIVIVKKDKTWKVDEILGYKK